jgi:hypothetical protein
MPEPQISVPYQAQPEIRLRRTVYVRLDGSGRLGPCCALICH